jgi:uncharacterized protein
VAARGLADRAAAGSAGRPVIVLALLLGLAIGLSLGALGGGGAVLALPVLVYVLGEDVHAATTGSLAIVAAAALTGGTAQASRARVCWPQVTLFAPAALAGAVAGTVAGAAVSGAALLLGFVPVLFAAAAFTWRRAGADYGGDESCPPVDARRTLAAGLLVGVLTGFFGVGGFLVVPMLALALRFPLRRAIGTSLVIVAFVSLAGLAVHLWHSADLAASSVTAMALGCAAGALAGARLGEHVPRRTLGHAFALLAATVGVYILVASAWLGGAPQT